MDKTFNLKGFLEKRANFAYEGAQGYFLAQSRAWMNCSKCKRKDGKTAQEAWQECFDEFQKGDRTMSWLTDYAKDSADVVSKEAAVDYTDEIQKIATTGVPLQEAVMGAIKTAQSKWWERIRDKVTGGPGQKAVKNREQSDIKQNRPVPHQPKIDAKTYNQLLYITRLIKANEFDSSAIRKMITDIPSDEVREALGKYVQYINQTEQEFANQVNALAEAAKQMIGEYEAGQRAFSRAKPEQATPATPATAPAAVPPRVGPAGVRPEPAMAAASERGFVIRVTS